MFEKKLLSNGLRLILAPMPQVKSVTVLVMVEAGSRYENVKNNGISHFLEHMMFKGTKKRPSKQDIAVLLDGIGASFNAFTSKEYTGFYVKTSMEHRDLIMDVLSDMVLNSLYPAAEVERERGVITEEINMDEDDPAGRVFQVFEALMFDKSPLGMRISGEKENIAAISRDEIVSYVRQMYHTGSMVVTVAGAIGDSPSAASDLVEKYFGEVIPGNENTYERVKIEQENPKVKIYEKKTEQAHFCLGFPGYSMSHPDRYVASVMANILGGNMSSRLFQEVREKRGLAYYVSAGSDEYLDTGYVLANAGVRLEAASEAIQVVLEQFNLMTEKAVLASELRRAKDYAKGKMILALEDSFRVASFFAGQELLEKKILTPEEILAKVEAVTEDDILRVAKDIFNKKLINLAVVGPFKDSEKFGKIVGI